MNFSYTTLVSLGVLPGLSFAVGAQRVDAGVDGAGREQGIWLGLRHWRLPVVDGEYPLTVLELDVGFVDDALGQGVGELDGA